VKAAIEREATEASDARISSSGREQARPQVRNEEFLTLNVQYSMFNIQ